jgi:DNA-binding NarL/FixJ family response regulator
MSIVAKTGDTPDLLEASRSQKHVITVSIVEDDAPVRRIFAGWIGQADSFQLLSQHADGAEAVEKLPAVKPDIVVTDINLPHINGVDCVRRLKPVMPGTQFVMVTVYEDADHIFQALEAGAIGYLLKQTPREELLAALREVFDGGSPMSSNIARKVVQSFQKTRPMGEAEGLSAREQEVLGLLAKGYLYKEIAETLSISVATVNTYIRRIYEKLHVRSRSQAVAKFVGGRIG